MRIKDFLIYLQYTFSFGYFWCGARYLVASYIATENEYFVMVILAS